MKPNHFHHEAVPPHDRSGKASEFEENPPLEIAASLSQESFVDLSALGGISLDYSALRELSFDDSSQSIDSEHPLYATIEEYILGLRKKSDIQSSESYNESSDEEDDEDDDADADEENSIMVFSTVSGRSVFGHKKNSKYSNMTAMGKHSIPKKEEEAVTMQDQKSQSSSNKVEASNTKEPLNAGSVDDKVGRKFRFGAPSPRIFTLQPGQKKLRAMKLNHNNDISIKKDAIKLPESKLQPPRAGSKLQAKKEISVPPKVVTKNNDSAQSLSMLQEKKDVSDSRLPLQKESPTKKDSPHTLYQAIECSVVETQMGVSTTKEKMLLALPKKQERVNSHLQNDLHLKQKLYKTRSAPVASLQNFPFQAGFVGNKESDFLTNCSNIKQISKSQNENNQSSDACLAPQLCSPRSQSIMKNLTVNSSFVDEHEIVFSSDAGDDFDLFDSPRLWEQCSPFRNQGYSFSKNSGSGSALKNEESTEKPSKPFSDGVSLDECESIQSADKCDPTPSIVTDASGITKKSIFTEASGITKKSIVTEASGITKKSIVTNASGITKNTQKAPKMMRKIRSGLSMFSTDGQKSIKKNKSGLPPRPPANLTSKPSFRSKQLFVETKDQTSNAERNVFLRASDGISKSFDLEPAKNEDKSSDVRIPVEKSNQADTILPSEIVDLSYDKSEKDSDSSSISLPASISSQRSTEAKTKSPKLQLVAQHDLSLPEDNDENKVPPRSTKKARESNRKTTTRPSAMMYTMPEIKVKFAEEYEGFELVRFSPAARPSPTRLKFWKKDFHKSPSKANEKVHITPTADPQCRSVETNPTSKISADCNGTTSINKKRENKKIKTNREQTLDKFDPALIEFSPGQNESNILKEEEPTSVLDEPVTLRRMKPWQKKIKPVNDSLDCSPGSEQDLLVPENLEKSRSAASNEQKKKNSQLSPKVGSIVDKKDKCNGERNKSKGKRFIARMTRSSSKIRKHDSGDGKGIGKDEKISEDNVQSDQTVSIRDLTLEKANLDKEVETKETESDSHPKSRVTLLRFMDFNARKHDVHNAKTVLQCTDGKTEVKIVTSPEGLKLEGKKRKFSKAGHLFNRSRSQPVITEPTMVSHALPLNRTDSLEHRFQKLVSGNSDFKHDKKQQASTVADDNKSMPALNNVKIESCCSRSTMPARNKKLIQDKYIPTKSVDKSKSDIKTKSVHVTKSMDPTKMRNIAKLERISKEYKESKENKELHDQDRSRKSSEKLAEIRAKSLRVKQKQAKKMKEGAGDATVATGATRLSAISDASRLTTAEKMLARRLANDIKVLAQIEKKRRSMGLTDDHSNKTKLKKLEKSLKVLQNLKMNHEALREPDEDYTKATKERKIKFDDDDDDNNTKLTKDRKIKFNDSIESSSSSKASSHNSFNPFNRATSWLRNKAQKERR